MKDRKHLYWVIGLVLITIILSGTLIWINSHSWTVRFEMDDNTKEAVKSIRWDNFDANIYEREQSNYEESFFHNIYVSTNDFEIGDCTDEITFYNKPEGNWICLKPFQKIEEGK